MIPNGSPHPHPQRQQKSPARGQHKLEKTQLRRLYMIFIKKTKKTPCQMASKGVRTNTTPAVSPRGSRKWKSSNEDKHDHGQEKRRLSTLFWGEEIHANMSQVQDKTLPLRPNCFLTLVVFLLWGALGVESPTEGPCSSVVMDMVGEMSRGSHRQKGDISMTAWVIALLLRALRQIN